MMLVSLRKGARLWGISPKRRERGREGGREGGRKEGREGSNELTLTATSSPLFLSTARWTCPML